MLVNKIDEFEIKIFGELSCFRKASFHFAHHQRPDCGSPTQKQAKKSFPHWPDRQQGAKAGKSGRIKAATAPIRVKSHSWIKIFKSSCHMSLYEIPLTPEPQSFDITLAGRDLKLFVRWLQSPAPDAPGGWQLDIYETPDDLLPVVLGIPLVVGCDLLFPYQDKRLGGSLYVSGDLPPDLNNLGTESVLFFETGDEA